MNVEECEKPLIFHHNGPKSLTTYGQCCLQVSGDIPGSSWDMYLWPVNTILRMLQCGCMHEYPRGSHEMSQECPGMSVYLEDPHTWSVHVCPEDPMTYMYDMWAETIIWRIPWDVPGMSVYLEDPHTWSVCAWVSGGSCEIYVSCVGCQMCQQNAYLYISAVSNLHKSNCFLDGHNYLV